MNPQSDATWLFQVGDPTLGAWLVTIGYLTASLLCLRISLFQNKNETVVGKSHSVIRLNSRLFWLIFGLLTLTLGLNKQLDIQTLLIELLRNRDGQNSTNETSRIGTTSFLIFFVATISYAYIVFSSVLYRSNIDIRLGLVSVALIQTYVIYRASVIHQFYGAIQAGSGMDKLVLMTEPAGVLLLIYVASKSLKQVIVSNRLTNTGVTKANTEY